MLNRFARVAAAGAALVLAAQPASAQFIRSNPGFATNVTFRNDDSSFDLLNAGFTMSWNGTTTNLVGLNNNGYAALNATPGYIVPCNPNTTCGYSVLQVFNYDLDSRNLATSPLTYGTSTIGGRNAFGANWLNFGYYSHGGPVLNFQLVLIDRSDIAAGDFDVEYNYGNLGGGAYAGWTSPSAFYEIANAGPAIANTRYTFQARNGVIAGGTHITTTTPEPATVGLMAAGLGLLGVAARRRRTA